MTRPFTLAPLESVITRIKDEVAIKDDETYTRLTIRMNGRGIDIRDKMSGFEIGTKKQFVAKSGQLVLSKIDARNGAFGILPERCDKAIITGNFWAFDVDHTRLLPKFFDYLTKTPLFLDFCVRASEGTTNRRYLQEGAFLSQEIPLPPLDEQRHIVARIEELAAKVEEAKELRFIARDEQGAVLSRAIGALFDNRSAGWIAATVNDIAESLDAGWSPQCEELPAESDQWGVLKTTSVQWCEFWPHENKRLPPSAVARPDLALKAGDVLVTRAGPMKRVGVPATVRCDHRNLMISDKIIRIRPKRKSVNARFLEYALSSPQAQEHLVARKTGLADAQVNISQPILRATPFAYPSLAEQVHIVAELDTLKAKLDTVKALQAQTADELDAMLRAILDKAFKGEL